MRLDGLHHVTAITADAPANVAFYCGTLGLRLVKKTVNYDQPEVYHLYYGDEQGSPGTILTFFEYPGAPRGRPGAGMVHRLSFRVAAASLAWWHERLSQRGLPVEREGEALRFGDPDGLELELVVAAPDEPAGAPAASDVPAEHALRGLCAVQAASLSPEASHGFLTGVLGFRPGADAYELAAAPTPARYVLRSSGAPGAWASTAGTVHHVAWAVADDDCERWQQRLAEAGANPTPVLDRTYFRSVYFREPSGVLFELATHGPGFAVDEPGDSLGAALVLPEDLEPLRPRLERALTPVSNPRTGR